MACKSSKKHVLLPSSADSISSLACSPGGLKEFVVSGTWGNEIRCYQIKNNRTYELLIDESHGGPVLDVEFSPDGQKILSSSCDKSVRLLNLETNQSMSIGKHGAPVKTVNLIDADYQIIMSGSWDKTLKFWDIRSAAPIMVTNLPGFCACSDVKYPKAVVGTAGRGLLLYDLTHGPLELKRMESILQYQHRCLSIFMEDNMPVGVATGSVAGRVAVQYFEETREAENFAFKCHRSNPSTNGQRQYFAINDIDFNQKSGIMATSGSDGVYSFWNAARRTKIETSVQHKQSISAGKFNGSGNKFVFSVSYDWAKGSEGHDVTQKNEIRIKNL